MFTVTLTRSNGNRVILSGVTEVHYNYGNGGTTAFESDIHGEGFTAWNTEILEMEIIAGGDASAPFERHCPPLAVPAAEFGSLESREAAWAHHALTGE